MKLQHHLQLQEHKEKATLSGCTAQQRYWMHGQIKHSNTGRTKKGGYKHQAANRFRHLTKALCFDNSEQARVKMTGLMLGSWFRKNFFWYCIWYIQSCLNVTNCLCCVDKPESACEHKWMGQNTEAQVSCTYICTFLYTLCIALWNPRLLPMQIKI